MSPFSAPFFWGTQKRGLLLPKRAAALWEGTQCCEGWNREKVVHSFRTVVADYGAHRGFIISKAGFRSGAREAARNTHVQLVTLDELQAIFFDRWRVAMGEHLIPSADRLFPYWDYPGKMPKIKWGQEHIERQQELVAAYLPILSLGPLARMQGFTQEFPMTLPAINEAGQVDGEIVLGSASFTISSIKTMILRSGISNWCTERSGVRTRQVPFSFAASG